MEYFFWRNLATSVAHPVCDSSEGLWIKQLCWAQADHHLISLNTRNVATPNNLSFPCLTITKTRACFPTSIVIDSQQPLLLGAILGIKTEADRPLRPLRPQVHYSPESEFGLDLISLEAQAGFDESEPLINIFMELLRRLRFPVNPLLPDVIRAYWLE